MRLYSPVDLTGNVNMIEKLVLDGFSCQYAMRFGRLHRAFPEPLSLRGCTKYQSS